MTVDPEVYERAVELIELLGWWPGPDLVPGNEADGGETGADGSLCLAAAVIEADPTRAQVHLRFLKEVLEIDPDEGSLAEWNDEDGRTKEAVMGALWMAQVAARAVA